MLTQASGNYLFSWPHRSVNRAPMEGVVRQPLFCCPLASVFDKRPVGSTQTNPTIPPVAGIRFGSRSRAWAGCPGFGFSILSRHAAGFRGEFIDTHPHHTKIGGKKNTTAAFAEIRFWNLQRSSG